MFMDESQFDDVEEIRITSKFVNRPSTASTQPSNSMRQEDDEDGGFRSTGTIGTPSSSRARMLAQQRELQLKKRQSAVQSGGMVRSSLESLGSAGGSPMQGSGGGGQFTPALRQFSQPKTLRDSQETSEFSRPADDMRGSQSFSKGARKARYSDEEDEEEDYRPARSNAARQSRDSPPPSKSRSAGRGSHDDDYGRSNARGNARGSYDDDYDTGRGRGTNNKAEERWGAGNTSHSRGGDDDRFRFDPAGEYGRGGGGATRQAAEPSVQYASMNSRAEAEHGRSGGWNNTNSAAQSYSAAAQEQRNDAAVLSPSRALPAAAPQAPDLSNMRRFLTSPLPKACGVVQCYIRRNKSGTHKLFPVYSLYLKEGDVFLMASKKRPKNKTSNYLISSDQNNLNKGGSSYLGKLRSNFVGTEFQIFDDGVNPKDVDPDEGTGTNTNMRCELGGVMYAANVLGSRGPRKMQVALPGLDENDQIIRWKDGQGPGSGSQGGDDMLTRMKDRNLRDLVYLINKPPRWNEQVGAYVLNFNGRVTMASVKNFQLVDPEEQNAVVLQFGRVGKDEFTMDMQYPISPFQAFAVTLSSFDSKIACD